MNSPTTAPLPVFVPFFRKNLVLEDFCEILQETCAVNTAVVHTKIVRARDGTVDPTRLHFYAFLTVTPTSLTKLGRNLAKNLRNHVSTFVSYDKDCYMELKPFMTTQQRIDRGYCVAPTESSALQHSTKRLESVIDVGFTPGICLDCANESGKSIFDLEGDRGWMIQEYDNLMKEIYDSIHHLT